MDKVIFALQPKLLCLNHQQSFAAYVFKVLSGNAISFIRITISAFYEPDVGILKHDVIFLRKVKYVRFCAQRERYFINARKFIMLDVQHNICFNSHQIENFDQLVI